MQNITPRKFALSANTSTIPWSTWYKAGLLDGHSHQFGLHPIEPNYILCLQWPEKQPNVLAAGLRSRRFLGGVAFLTALGVAGGFFVRLRISNWIIFYITLGNWEFLLKWYNFFWNCCWNREFLLCTTISIKC